MHLYTGINRSKLPIWLTGVDFPSNIAVVDLKTPFLINIYIFFILNKVKPILVSIGNVAAWLQAETWMGDRTIQDFGTQRYCPHFSSLNRTKSPYAMELTPRGGVSEKKKIRSTSNAKEAKIFYSISGMSDKNCEILISVRKLMVALWK